MKGLFPIILLLSLGVVILLIAWGVNEYFKQKQRVQTIRLPTSFRIIRNRDQELGQDVILFQFMENPVEIVKRTTRLYPLDRGVVESLNPQGELLQLSVETDLFLSFLEGKNDVYEAQVLREVVAPPTPDQKRKQLER